MVSERLRAVHQAQPFLPFTLHMSDGRSLKVTHPELLAVAPTGRYAVLILPDESTHFIDILLITDIELKVPKGRNDKWRRKAG